MIPPLLLSMMIYQSQWEDHLREFWANQKIETFELLQRLKRMLSDV